MSNLPLGTQIILPSGEIRVIDTQQFYGQDGYYTMTAREIAKYGPSYSGAGVGGNGVHNIPENLSEEEILNLAMARMQEVS